MTKAQTQLIESSNSSIRDNVARFNRKTKRYTKSLDLLLISSEIEPLNEYQKEKKERIGNDF